MSIIISLLTALLFCIGVIGTIIPGLPGIGFVFAGILLYAFADSFTHISIASVIYLGIGTLVAFLAQYACSLWATKSAGGNSKALIGTFLGALLGITVGPIGIFVGAFLGALAGALMEGKDAQVASRIALQSVVGVLGGSVIQFLLSIALIIAFLLIIFF